MNTRAGFAKFLSWIDVNTPAASPGRAATSDIAAERSLHGAIADLPASAEPALHLGGQLEQRGEYARAAEIYAIRLGTAPRNPAIHRRHFECLLRLGRLEHARAAFDALPGWFGEEILTEGAARAMLAAFIEAGGFDPGGPAAAVSAGELGALFFLRPLAADLGAVAELTGMLTERHLPDFAAAAKAHAEAAGGRFVYASADTLFEVGNRTETENSLVAKAFWERPGERAGWLRSIPPHLPALYADVPDFSASYAAQVFTGPGIALRGGRVVLRDRVSAHVNVIRGRRRTTGGGADGAARRVLVFGGSAIYGFGCDDARTMPSRLQARLDASEPGCWRVENHGLRGTALPVWIDALLRTPVVPGDVVVLAGVPRLDAPPPGLDVLHVDFARPHGHGEIFADPTHLGPRGNDILAARVFGHIGSLPGAAEPPAPDTLHLPPPPAAALVRALLRRLEDRPEDAPPQDAGAPGSLPFQMATPSEKGS